MKALARAAVTLLALLLLAEEWLWDALKRGMRHLAAALQLQRVEDGLRRLRPWASLLVMLLPALLLPFKLAALWALAHGHPLLGLAVLLAAKLSGTALAAYLFELVRDNARRIAAFDRLYTAVIGLLARARAWVDARPAVQAARARVAAWRAQAGQGRSAWARRFAVARRRKT